MRYGMRAELMGWLIAGLLIGAMIAVVWVQVVG